MVTWNDLSRLSKTAITATGLTILCILVPPLSMLFASVAIVSSGISLARTRHEGFNQVDVVSLAVSVLVVAVIVTGTIVYGIADAR